MQRRRGAAWPLALGLLAASACGGEPVPNGPGAFCPPDCPAQATKTAQPAPGAPAAWIAAAASAAPAAPPPDPNAFDPAGVRLVLDDARLASVEADVEKEQYGKAAELLAAAIAALPQGDAARASWLYQLGKLRALGGNPGGAAQAFEACAALGGPLADFALVQAAEWLVGTTQYDAALADLARVGGDPALAPSLDLVTADALLGKGDVDGAAARFRAYLARERHPAQWVTISLRFAGMLLGRPSEAHAEEAIAVARRVIDEAPGGAGSGNAKDIEKHALATLPFAKQKRLEHPTSDELLARGRALVASQQPKEALAVANKLLKLPRAKKGAFGCDAHLVKADALKGMRKKKDAAEAYLAAVTACAGEPHLAEALYNAGRTLAQSGRTTEAMARYAELERALPHHRLADDARLKGALAALDANDEPRFVDLLTRMPDDYPDGDMVVEGLFTLALHELEKGDAAKAAAALERAKQRAPHERAYWAAGRLPYWLARAHLALGKTDEAEAELAGVVREHPLSFYMALAYARLAERSRPAADKVVEEAIAREPRGTFTLPKG
ncbi:MAG TPA: tetratricopeptide repeat protein, partial [Minicystis sp.]|nr:tetratricopeptide repeat protein [Minicystis sp.]